MPTDKMRDIRIDGEKRIKNCQVQCVKKSPKVIMKCMYACSQDDSKREEQKEKKLKCQAQSVKINVPVV